MVPLPLMLDRVPPVTRMSACVKSVLASLSVKVMAAVCPVASVDLSAVMAMVGAVVSAGAGLVRAS